MRSRVLPILVSTLAAALAPAVRAGECIVNDMPIAPATLAYALEVGPGASLPGQLSGVPFSTVSFENVVVRWASCGGECLVSEAVGEAQCGNLVEDPIDAFASVEYFGLPDPTAFADASAEQGADGKWDVAAVAFVSPQFEHPNGSAGFSYTLGTREVIDVTSASAAEELPLDIRLRAAGHMGVQQCWGNVFRWIPSHSLRFRVTEHSDAPPFARDLVPTVVADNFFVRDRTYSVAVRPNSMLIVDVWLRLYAAAIGANDIFGNQCAGGYSLALMQGGSNGIQLGFTPDAALTLTPRSGFTYRPVPEPAGAAAAALSALVLIRVRRRVRSA